MSDFFKNKSVGYYILAFITLFSLILTIIFFASFANPTIEAQMGNKAVGMAPETIGIFLLAGVLIEGVALFAPEFRFFHFAAVVMFGLAIYKDVIIMGDFFAGFANGVMYNGGNVGLNMFLFIALMLIELLAIVVGFMGFIKPGEEE